MMMVSLALVVSLNAGLSQSASGTRSAFGTTFTVTERDSAVSGLLALPSLPRFAVARNEVL